MTPRQEALAVVLLMKKRFAELEKEGKVKPLSQSMWANPDFDHTPDPKPSGGFSTLAQPRDATPNTKSTGVLKSLGESRWATPSTESSGSNKSLAQSRHAPSGIFSKPGAKRPVAIKPAASLRQNPPKSKYSLANVDDTDSFMAALLKKNNSKNVSAVANTRMPVVTDTKVQLKAEAKGASPLSAEVNSFESTSSRHSSLSAVASTFEPKSRESSSVSPKLNPAAKEFFVSPKTSSPELSPLAKAFKSMHSTQAEDSAAAKAILAKVDVGAAGSTPSSKSVSSQLSPFATPFKPEQVDHRTAANDASASLDGDVPELKLDFSDKETSAEGYDGSTGSLDAIASDLSILVREVATMKNGVQAMTSNIQGLQQAVLAMTGTIQVIHRDVCDTKGRIAVVEGQVAELKQQLKTVASLAYTPEPSPIVVDQKQNAASSTIENVSKASNSLSANVGGHKMSTSKVATTISPKTQQFLGKHQDNTAATSAKPLPATTVNKNLKAAPAQNAAKAKPSAPVNPKQKPATPKRKRSPRGKNNKKKVDYSANVAKVERLSGSSGSLSSSNGSGNGEKVVFENRTNQVYFSSWGPVLPRTTQGTSRRRS